MKIDGVSMGSSLSPTLANIVMIALEDEIIKDLFDNGIINRVVKGGSQSHFPPEIFPKSHAVPVGLLLKIPVEVIKIPGNKK